MIPGLNWSERFMTYVVALQCLQLFFCSGSHFMFLVLTYMRHLWLYRYVSNRVYVNNCEGWLGRSRQTIYINKPITNNNVYQTRILEDMKTFNILPRTRQPDGQMCAPNAYFPGRSEENPLEGNKLVITCNDSCASLVSEWASN